MSTEPVSSASDPAPGEVCRHRLKRGDVVHVRPGARHPMYPDLPMGGWTGTVERMQRHREHKGRRYWVHFLTSTTDRLHPVYADRERRDGPDGYEPWDTWVIEELLQPGEAPPETIEQPDLPPWAQQAGARQVRKLFGLDPDDEYPNCNGETARVWKAFLSEHLPIPHELLTTAEHDFDVDHVELRRILGPEEVSSDVDDEPHGLYAEVSVDGEIDVVRFEYVIPFDSDPHDTLFRDYAHWFHVVHGHDPYVDDVEDERGLSREELDRIFDAGIKAAWKAHFGRLPDESDMELASSLVDQLKSPDAGRLFDRKQEAAVEEPKDLEAPEPIRAAPRVGRNDPCPCGSGKKFKKCCLRER